MTITAAKTPTHGETHPSYRVLWRLAIVKGTAGSHGTFYQGQAITSWDTADGNVDTPDGNEISRLLTLGAIEATNG